MAKFYTRMFLSNNLVKHKQGKYEKFSKIMSHKNYAPPNFRGMPQLSSSVFFTFAPLHLFCFIIISANSDYIGNNFRESMLKNPTPYGMAKLTISWDKITDIFSAIKGHSQLKKACFKLDTACSPCFTYMSISLPKASSGSHAFFYHSHRKQLAKKRDNHDIMTRPMKRKSSQFMDNIDKRLK